MQNQKISEVNKMTIEIIRTPEEIEQVIATIESKSTAYKQVVCSAVLSAVAHYQVHNDYTLIQAALDTVFSVNYRDYLVVVEFIKQNTWVAMKMENQRRKQHFTVVGDLLSEMGPRGTDETQKDYNTKRANIKAKIELLKNRFTNFSVGNPIPMKNVEWVKGEDPENRFVMVNFQADIFKWYDDVKYIRVKEQENGSGSGEGDNNTNNANLRTMSQDAAQKLAANVEDRLIKSLNKPVASVIIHMLERFEDEVDVIITDEEEETLRRRVEHFIMRAKARAEAKARIEEERKAAEQGSETNEEVEEAEANNNAE